ncbi:MAG: hypothetical protein RIB84_12990 [Sneathiellaceae bacterium]
MFSASARYRFLSLAADTAGISIRLQVASMLCIMLILAFAATVYFNFGSVIG